MNLAKEATEKGLANILRTRIFLVYWRMYNTLHSSDFRGIMSAGITLASVVLITTAFPA